VSIHYLEPIFWLREPERPLERHGVLMVAIQHEGGPPSGVGTVRVFKRHFNYRNLASLVVDHRGAHFARASSVHYEGCSPSVDYGAYLLGTIATLRLSRPISISPPLPAPWDGSDHLPSPVPPQGAKYPPAAIPSFARQTSSRC
jgi:hypothetical protein